ncbi:MAG TPA: tRNA lysidine(34) synthetase TilS [Candidatus Saccharimonadales bacterium]
MDLDIGPGVYVLAVSGGVDSVVLLDMVVKNTQSKLNNVELIVAHFDHGIRHDSAEDTKFVGGLAEQHGLRFTHGEASLGPNASEEQARTARYEFLFKVVEEYKAKALITAHHQDDLIETALLNILRGTNRRGLSSLQSSDSLMRPLLNITKASLVDYAKDNHLGWREDSTNTDERYLRNYLRLNILQNLTSENRTKLVKLISNQTELNGQIDELLEQLIREELKDNQIPRLWLATLDSKLINEVLATWLRQNGVYNYNQTSLKRLNTELRVAKVNSLVDAIADRKIIVGKDNLALKPIER